MKNKFGSWSTGGKSADAGGAPIGKATPKKLKAPLKGDMDIVLKPTKMKNKNRANAKKPKAFGDDGVFKRLKKGL